MTDYAAKFATDVLYQRIPEAVEAHPAAQPLTIAYGVVSRLTREECRVVLDPKQLGGSMTR